MARATILCVTRRIDVTERRARLAVRHHLAPAARGAASPDGVAAAVADIIALHGTDPASVYLAAWARTGASLPDIEQALYAEGTLVRMLGMRRTVFVAPVEHAPIVQAACTDAIAVVQRKLLLKHLAEAGHDGGDAGLVEALLAAVGSGDPTRLSSDMAASLASHRVVWAAEQARLTRSVVTL